jgi:endonuclease YncB( thermonuclease family)
VNLRPLGERDGALLARVSTLQRGGGGREDLSAALVASGLATPAVDSLNDARCSGLS